MTNPIRSVRLTTLLLACFCLVATLTPAASQTSKLEKPVLVVDDFQALEGVTANEAKSLRGLILSYVDSYRLFRIVDSASRDLVLKEQAFSQSSAAAQGDSPPSDGLLHGDFLMTGTIGKVLDRYILTVEMTSV
jgi:hypothetical protein